MTEEKINKSCEFSIQEDWRNLNPHDQEIVTNFFNLHNTAHLLYNIASEPAKKFVDMCIFMQQNVDDQEKIEV